MVSESVAERYQELIQGRQLRPLGADQPVQPCQAGGLAALPASLQGSEMLIQFSVRHRPQFAEDILVVLRLPQVSAPRGNDRIDYLDQAAHRSPPILRPPAVAFMGTR